MQHRLRAVARAESIAVRTCIISEAASRTRSSSSSLSLHATGHSGRVCAAYGVLPCLWLCLLFLPVAQDRLSSRLAAARMALLMPQAGTRASPCLSASSQQRSAARPTPPCPAAPWGPAPAGCTASCCPGPAPAGGAAGRAGQCRRRQARSASAAASRTSSGSVGAEHASSCAGKGWQTQALHVG